MLVNRNLEMALSQAWTPPRTPGCVLWTAADLGVTPGAVLLASGSGAPPVLTLTGTTPCLPGLRIECTTLGTLGVWVFRYSTDGGATWTSNVTSAATVALGGLAAGLTLNIAAGTAATDQVWISRASDVIDSSGSANPLTQSSAAGQPQLIANTKNGRSVFRYINDVSLGLQCADSTHLSWERTQAWTMVAVVKPSQTPADSPLLSKGNPLTGGFGMVMQGSTTVRVGIASSGANRLIMDGTVSAMSGTWRLMLATYDGSSTPGGVVIRVNGANVALGAAANSLSATIINASKFQMGGQVSSTANDFAGDVAEAAAWGRVLAATEIARVEAYLNAKWAVY